MAHGLPSRFAGATRGRLRTVGPAALIDGPPGRSSHAYFYTLAAVTMLYSVLRGLRSPNLWSATQWLFNYDFGFSKRGLVGALLERGDWPVLYTYPFLFWASLALFVVNLLLLAALCVQGVRRDPWPLQCAVVVYFSSMGIVFLAHTVGYFDHLGLLIALVAIAIRNFWWRLAFVAVFFSLSILAHETGFPVFGPLIVCTLLLQIPRGRPGKEAWCLLLLVLWLSAEASWVGSATLSRAAAENLYAALQQRADFPLRGDAFLVLTRSLSSNVAITAANWHGHYLDNNTVMSAPIALPSIAFILWLTHVTQKAQGRGVALVLFAVAASLSPLALHLFGWDGVRWNTLAITTSFLVLLATTLSDTPAATAPSLRRYPFLLPACVFLVLFNLGTSVPLFDGFEVQSFPFRKHVAYLRDLWSGHDALPSVPDK